MHLGQFLQQQQCGIFSNFDRIATFSLPSNAPSLFTFGSFSGPDLLPSNEPFYFTSRTVTLVFSSNFIRADIVISQP
jgi:hypothetical protein